MTRYLIRDRIAVAAALVAPLAAAAVLLPFRAGWSNTNVALQLVVVAVAVAVGNRVAGGLAAVSAAVWFDFFFTVPYYRFTIRSSADVTTAVLLFLTGLAVSQLAVRARRLQVLAITDAGYLAQIHETTALAQSARSPQVVVDHYGRFLLTPKPGSKPSLQARLVAVSLAELVGRAFSAGEAARSAALTNRPESAAPPPQRAVRLAAVRGAAAVVEAWRRACPQRGRLPG